LLCIVGEKKLAALLDSVLGLRIKLTLNRLIGEKHINLIFLYVHGNLQNENEDPKMLEPQTSIPFDTKRNKLWGCDKTKGLGLGTIVNHRTLTRKYMGEAKER
jgi:hypothetical protein